MLPIKSIRKKIERDWKRLVEAANNRGKGIKLDNIISKLDLMYDILYCECDILSCEQKGCSAECEKVVHMDCNCPKEKKIPQIELLFLRDQRLRNKKGLAIGNKDRVESERISTKISNTL